MELSDKQLDRLVDLVNICGEKVQAYGDAMVPESAPVYPPAEALYEASYELHCFLTSLLTR